MAIKTFEVGGCVRDLLLGVESSDVDLLLVGAKSFDEGIACAIEMGLVPIVGTFKPEFLTFKASVPKRGHWLRDRCKAVDFVIARKDSTRSDGRRPDFVEPGTLEDDLRRRDFTVNALARDLETGEIIDLFDGRKHLEQRLLKFVGDPFVRIREDGLRVLRALRFSVTKGFQIVDRVALMSDVARGMLDQIPRERVQQEMDKMFAHDTLAALAVLDEFHMLREAIFKDGLRLSATLKQPK